MTFSVACRPTKRHAPWTRRRATTALRRRLGIGHGSQPYLSQRSHAWCCMLYCITPSPLFPPAMGVLSVTLKYNYSPIRILLRRCLAPMNAQAYVGFFVARMPIHQWRVYHTACADQNSAYWVMYKFSEWFFRPHFHLLTVPLHALIMLRYTTTTQVRSDDNCHVSNIFMLF